MVEEKEVSDVGGHKADKSKSRRAWLKRAFIAVSLALLAVVVLAFGYVYAASPAAIRNPKMDHLHFRMQMVVNGQEVNFGSDAFQTPYAPDQCSGELTAVPVHFHDNKGQFVHIHWANITGGIVLKDYGWNLIGGPDATLGYRLDNLPRITRVPIHGDALPKLPNNAKFWVYTGDEHSYQTRSFEDFKKQTLEQFLGKESNFPKQTRGGLLAWLFPAASAHGGVDDGHTVIDATEEERLTRLNNLIGNIVIFVQNEQPSDAQIKARFDNLSPLPESTCGG